MGKEKKIKGYKGLLSPNLQKGVATTASHGKGVCNDSEETIWNQ